MLHKDMLKSEIEKALEGKGEFIQIHHLNNLLNEPLERDTKRFIYQKLAHLYEKLNMFNDAARMFDNLAIISIAFIEKIKNYVKEAELYIKAGAFEKADASMRKAMNEANTNEKAEIYFVVKDLYKKQAEGYEMEMKRNHATRIYEKLLEMNITQMERKEIKEKLLGLYQKLGKFERVKVLESVGG